MKNRITELIIIVLLIAAVVVIGGCEAVDAAGGKETDIVTDPPPATETETDDSLPVVVDPADRTSRGLAYLSNGDGSCTLTGIGSCTDAVVIIPEKTEAGETVTKIAAFAFAGNTSITAVQIPAGITEIGNGAFASCPALSYITVAESNTKYTDMGGILYTADETRLLCLPAGSSYVSITLTKKIKQIAEGATDGCIALKKVLYEGSREDWKTVNVAAKNTPFTVAEMTFMTPSGK